MGTDTDTGTRTGDFYIYVENPDSGGGGGGVIYVEGQEEPLATNMLINGITEFTGQGTLNLFFIPGDPVNLPEGTCIDKMSIGELIILFRRLTNQ